MVIFPPNILHIISQVKQHMTIQKHYTYIHLFIYLMHETIGESYKDEYYSIYNKNIRGGNLFGETEKRL